jgi:Gpi18-like mannosyltransferase
MTLRSLREFIASHPTFSIVALIALLLRIALIPNPGFEADVSFWKSWGLATLDHGVIKGLPLTNFNYPTPFAYILGIMVWIYSWFADPHIFNEFWSNTNLLFLTISKAFPIAADFGIAAAFLYIGKHAKKLGFPTFSFTIGGMSLYELASIVYLLSPLSLVDGALWGQIDSVGVLLFMASIFFVLKKQPFISGIIFIIAMMTKLQNMIYGPVLFVFIWQHMGLPGLTKAIGGAGLAFIVTNIEFILARQSWRTIASITGNYDYFPWLSLNAYNPWWIFSGAQGMEGSDKVMAIGITNAKTVGLFSFSSIYLLAILQQLKQKHSALMAFLTSLILVNAAFFLFQTQSHDRYAFPLSIFLLLAIPFYVATYSKVSDQIKLLKTLGWFYASFTIVYFYNLHTALIVNYPKNGLMLLNSLNTPSFTIAASLIQTLLFAFFILFLILMSKVYRVLVAVALVVFLSLVTLANVPLITKSPIPLASITPISAIAGYGARQVDMPVMANFGFDTWSPLSVQYAFYQTGIGTHAPAREVYDIAGKFKTLKTDYGVDTNGGPQGSVTFEVWGDGKRLFASEPIARFELPRHIDVDITGVKTLELVVTDGGNGNTDDHADWLNTYLIP